MTHSIILDGRWHGELHIYGDGLIAVAATVGLRLQRAVTYDSEPMTSWAADVTSGLHGGPAGSLGLIVRR